uniref:Variable surface glycoprotein n=1 Tax=Trypanosoma congolense TaxID=5692 RepID=Q26978_TRYCO|nr:variable surface glycoprotein [Trypanosoma congolense]
MKGPMLITLALILGQTAGVLGADKNQADYAALCNVYQGANAVYGYNEKQNTENTTGELFEEIFWLADWATSHQRENVSHVSISTISQHSQSSKDILRKTGSISEALQRRGWDKAILNGNLMASPLTAKHFQMILEEARACYGRSVVDLGVETAGFLAAKQAAAKAIFGKGKTKPVRGPEPDEETFYGVGGSSWTDNSGAGGSKTGSGRGCGDDGQEDAGISIISDLTCICLGRHSSTNTNAQKACSEGIDGGSGNFQTNANVLKGESGWGLIKTDCGKRGRALQQFPTSADLEARVEAYLGRIGAAGQNFKVGNAASGNCDGGNSEGQICITYKKSMGTRNEHGFEGISWVANLRTAALELQKAEAAAQRRQIEITKLRDVNTTAWSIFVASLSSQPSNGQTGHQQGQNKHLGDSSAKVSAPVGPDPAITGATEPFQTASLILLLTGVF